MDGTMKTHLGEDGMEQFTITTRVDGKVIREQKIHDPFIHSKTVVGISRWDLFKAMFRKQFEVKVEVAVHGSEGVLRAIMMLDPVQLEAETQSILAERAESRERHARGDYSGTNCYQASE
jgi:hypothetical protein